MNLAYNLYLDDLSELEFEQEGDQAQDRSREAKPRDQKARRNHYAQKSRPSVQHSGIHRRRNKRFGT